MFGCDNVETVSNKVSKLKLQYWYRELVVKTETETKLFESEALDQCFATCATVRISGDEKTVRCGSQTQCR